MENEAASRTLTIHLAKENRKPGSLIRNRDGVEERVVPLGGGVSGRLLIRRPVSKPPSWADFFVPHINPAEFGKVSSSSAVLLVPVYKRWAAVTFGQGRHLLSPDSFEDRFGLRVALNCIDEEKIRSIDKQTFDAIASHTLEQANQEANAGEFGFDIERDILRAVTGTPRHQDYGKRLTGMESLSAQVYIRLSDLHDLLELYHHKFFDDSYQDSFPWVDQIREVTDPGLEAALNETVVRMIRGRQLDRCWLAVPDILDWSRVSGFRYSEANRSPELYDIHLGTFLQALKDPNEVTMTTLKHRKVFCMGENDEVMRSWSVFSCLYCELDDEGRSYVLNAGKWYELENDFVKQVADSFARIPKYAGTFLDYDDETEGKYNERLVTLNSANYYLMDRNLTYHGGSMEFCDVFSKAKELVHIKRYGGSATLSHLFYQGVNSAEFFQMDEKYRKLVHGKLDGSFQVFDPKLRPKFEEFHVVFGIISRSDKPLTMPFFSRVGIRHAVRRLQGFGYKVSLAKIGVADTRRKRQKVRPKKLK
jgi:uncharacterized protein (TIGR04141 family)